MRAINKFSSVLAGLLIILTGGMIPSGFFVTGQNFSFKVHDLPSSWQVPSLLFVGIVCGPKCGLISVVAYLTIGLFYVPVFHGGGSIGYLATPDIGYIAGFIPAVWVVGNMIRSHKKYSIFQLYKACIIGLTIIHCVGIINLLIGTLFSRWNDTLLDLFLTYSVSTFPMHLLLCTGVSVISKLSRKILYIK